MNGASSSSCAATNASAGVPAPASTAWSACRSVADRPSAGAGSSSSSRRSAGARKGRSRDPPRALFRERDRVGCAESASQASVASASASRSPLRVPARASRALPRSTRRAHGSSPCRRTSRRRSARAHRPLLRPARARRGAGAGRRGRARTRGRPEYRLAAPRGSRLSRRSSADRIARRLPQPHSDRNAARARSRSRRAAGRNRPLVQHVLPQEDGAAERCPPERVAGALAVRDVQQRRPGQRLRAPPREVRGAARAAVEGVARAPDYPRELLSHASQSSDARVDLVDLRRHPDPQRLGGSARATPRGPQVVLDLGEREAELPPGKRGRPELRARAGGSRLR